MLNAIRRFFRIYYLTTSRGENQMTSQNHDPRVIFICTAINNAKSYATNLRINENVLRAAKSQLTNSGSAIAAYSAPQLCVRTITRRACEAMYPNTKIRVGLDIAFGTIGLPSNELGDAYAAAEALYKNGDTPTAEDWESWAPDYTATAEERLLQGLARTFKNHKGDASTNGFIIGVPCEPPFAELLGAKDMKDKLFRRVGIKRNNITLCFP